MSEECNYEKIEDYQIAFKCFEQRFFKYKKSIFRLDCDDEILNFSSIEYLTNNFINNGYAGDKSKEKKNQTSSIEKFYRQLTEQDFSEKIGIEFNDDNKIRCQAIEVLAHAVWLWRLPAFNSDGDARKRSVLEILNFVEEWKCVGSSKDDSLEKCLEYNKFFGNYKGFAMPGIGYNTNKANELAYIINFFNLYLNEKGEEEIITWLKKGKEVSTTTKATYTKEITKEKTTYKKIDISQIDVSKKISVNNALLHLISHDNYEPIISSSHKEKIEKVFKKLFEKDLDDKYEDLDIDAKIFKLKKILKKNDTSYHFYHKSIKNIWLGGLDFESKNIILHGAPGTGKTYMTEEAIKIKQKIEKNLEYKLVQFHPSYTYEDFMDGIKPTEIDSKSGQMVFKLKNGLFKQMCIDAFESLVADPENPKKFYFIADEINRAELSRVFGELLLCLEEDKRLKIRIETIEDKKVKFLEGTKVQTQNSMMWKDKDDVVVFVDTDGKILEDSDNRKEWYFGVPENLYFIGTMNDIDRSVDSFDMALRRRFIWKHYICDYDVIMEKYKNDTKIEDYLEICEALNKYITSNEGFNLGSSYELGHSYFMKPDEKKSLSQSALDTVWDENIAPLLKEYIRAIESDENEIQKKINKAKKIFKLK